jgi:hypothetical protein
MSAAAKDAAAPNEKYSSQIRSVVTAAAIFAQLIETAVIKRLDARHVGAAVAARTPPAQVIGIELLDFVPAKVAANPAITPLQPVIELAKMGVAADLDIGRSGWIAAIEILGSRRLGTETHHHNSRQYKKSDAHNFPRDHG